MSIIAVAYSSQIVAPAALSFAYAAMVIVRPFLGVGIVTALLMMFEPLLKGIVQAVALILRPRLSLEERKSRRHFHDALMISRMAIDLDQSQPNLAAELRCLAVHG